MPEGYGQNRHNVRESPAGYGQNRHNVREAPAGEGRKRGTLRENSYISGVKRWVMILLMLVPVPTWCQGQGGRIRDAEDRFWVTTPEDSLLAETILADLAGHAGKSVAELMVRAGMALVGQPYVAGTLDEIKTRDTSENSTGKKAGKEELRIYLTRTDCIIFVETCLALARTAAQGGDFHMFANEIRQSRYRNGRVEAYADRLHYTTEWARRGEARGVLKDVTRALGGAPLDRPVNYMSSHPESYPLMDDIDAIRKAEDGINSEPRYYIPKSKIAGALKDIRTGDIICLVTTVEGLDISHVAMAVVEDGTVRMLHASTGPMKVTVDPKTLQEYLAGRSSVSGIQVLRPSDIR